MTAIPGTSMPSRPTVKQAKAAGTTPPIIQSSPIVQTTPVVASVAAQQAPPVEKSTSMQVINVEEVRKQIDHPPKPKDPNPYEGVKYQTLNWWMGFGAIAGVIAALLGIFHAQFFVLAPLGPTLGALSWYVRKYMRKYAKNIDAFS